MAPLMAAYYRKLTTKMARSLLQPNLQTAKRTEPSVLVDA